MIGKDGVDIGEYHPCADMLREQRIAELEEENGQLRAAHGIKCDTIEELERVNRYYKLHRFTVTERRIILIMEKMDKTPPRFALLSNYKKGKVYMLSTEIDTFFMEEVQEDDLKFTDKMKNRRDLIKKLMQRIVETYPEDYYFDPDKKTRINVLVRRD